MIQADELRIGNLVSSFGTNGNPNSWNEIYINAEHIETCIEHPEWFKPIPFNDKYIKRLGIGQQGFDLFQIFKASDETYSMHINGKRMPIASIHHYQNVYFFITGNELKLDI